MVKITPNVSVLMPCYNESPEVCTEAIESILAQSYTDFEFLIILDNPKNDLLRVLCEAYATKDNRIRFFINSKNMKLVATLNKGLQLARGKYIARMDADDISFPNRLEDQLQYMEINQLDFVATWIKTMDENGHDITILKAPRNQDKLVFYLRHIGNYMWHPTWLIRSNILKKIGGYSDIRYAEDYHLVLRAVHCNICMGVMPEICLRYRVRSSSISSSNLWEQRLISKFLQKNFYRINGVTQAEIDDWLKAIGWRIGDGCSNLVVDIKKHSKKCNCLNYIFARLKLFFYNEWYRSHIYDVFKAEFMKKVVVKLYLNRK